MWEPINERLNVAIPKRANIFQNHFLHFPFGMIGVCVKTLEVILLKSAQHNLQKIKKKK